MKRVSEDSTGSTHDTARPRLSELAVNGTRLTLTYSEALDPNSVPGADQFTVWVNYTAVTLAATDAVRISGRVVTLTLASAVAYGDDVAVRYLVPTGLHATPIQDSAYNAAYEIEIRSVENSTPEPAAPQPIVPINPATEPVPNLTVELSLSISQGSGSTPISDSLKVYRVTGRETISQPFGYAIEFVHVDATNNPIDLNSVDVLGKSATLQIAVDDGSTRSSRMERNVHGVIEEFVVDEFHAPAGTGAASGNHYRVLLVPRMAALARNRQNRMHATIAAQTLEELIANKLLSRGPDYSTTESDKRAVLAEEDFRIDIDNDQLPLDALSHVTQHDETDLAFVQRLCEHHGVYFFFASNTDDTAGTVVFGNTNSPFGVIRFEPDPDHSTTATPVNATDGSSTPPGTYNEEHRLDIDLTLIRATGTVTGSQYSAPTDDRPATLKAVLCEFKSFDRFTAKRVYVIPDQGTLSNGRSRPTVLLDATGRGIYTDYDTHFSTEDAGDAFARIRSQEIRAASNYSTGWTNSPCVAPGRTFTKTPEGDLPRATGTTDPKYLVTAVEIEVRQAHADLNITVGGEVVQSGFGNRFSCIEFDEDGDFVYRPPRVTPVPRLHGVQTAYVGTGATGEDARPVLDEEGAYRIYSPFLDERAGFINEKPALTIDKLSKAVRKGEPYAGDGVGMHFPLKRNTEVLVAYRNGDPDRPVIAAAMPGPLDHASPVTEDNPTSHVIETSSGARFEIHDGAEDSDSRIALRSQGASARASYVRLGKADTASADGPEALEDPYEGKVLTVPEEQRDGIALFTADNIREAAGKDKVTHVQGTIRTDAGEDIYGRSVQRHLLRGRRMVITSGQEADEPVEGETIDVPGTNASLEDDDMLLLSKRDLHITAHGVVHKATLASEKTVDGDETRTTHGDTVTHHYGNTRRLVGLSTTKFVLGAETNVRVGAATLGVAGGWVRPWGPLSGRLYVGFAYYLWPQLFALQGAVQLTHTRVEIVSTKVNKVTKNLTLKKAFLRRHKANVDVETGMIKSGTFANYTIV